ncbi:MAG: hypothetical protein KY468_19325 [Armatimonadetes bacterium]|nr:hypothetical protein [Armatimonadota bacterium]
MNSLRTHRWGAWLALALLVLQGALPAFGSLGAWICPDNRPCAYMNKGAAPSDRASESGDPCVMRVKKKSCCHSPFQPKSSVQTSQECRFVSTRYPGPKSLIPTSLEQQKHTASLVPPSALDELLATHVALRPDFPLPDSSPSLSSAHPEITASRAPPNR